MSKYCSRLSPLDPSAVDLRHAVVTVTAGGMPTVTFDGRSFLPPPDSWSLVTFGAPMDAVAVCVEVYATDGVVHTDIIPAHILTQRTPTHRGTGIATRNSTWPPSVIHNPRSDNLDRLVVADVESCAATYE